MGLSSSDFYNLKSDNSMLRLVNILTAETISGFISKQIIFFELAEKAQYHTSVH